MKNGLVPGKIFILITPNSSIQVNVKTGNGDLHRDLGGEYIEKEIKKIQRSLEGILLQHKNIETMVFLDISKEKRRLRRTKPHKLA